MHFPLLLAVLAVFGLTGSASAATLAVTTTNDTVAADGQCSLREAITAANLDTAFNGCAAGSGADIVVLAAGEYRIDRAGAGEDANSTGDLDVRSSLTIQGAGADVTRIRGDRNDRVFDLAMPGAGQPVAVTITGVTIRNGDGIFGGAILAAAGASLVVSGCSIVNNTAAQGAGIASDGSLEVVNSAFHANAADNGGALWISGGPATLRNVTFDSNTSTGSGSVAVFNAPAILNNVTMTLNIADSDLDDFGDGALEVNANVSISNSIVARNIDLSLGGSSLVNPDCLVGMNGSLASAGHNIIGNIGTVCVLGGAQPGDQVGNAAQPINPLLQPFAVYGGTVETQPPTWASPALERGSPAAAGLPGACEADDARGISRPQGSRCDIGAAELDDLIFRDGFDPPLP
ncbi:MAG TPA: CSLREA domain-containing protein [Dokdonella sp.]|uniref:choice-of-anchor Q domain-containing protein n=2 Tax=Dokdonella sp. TaxID=2291710 RepID=UPI002BCE219F|nr:CSLREA domain-containing protein [Xanthomonadales bacterium]HQW76551.1 CSLREA domain-containing protein [Dokdonella sp.]HQX65326.1 CSLREA domain-containing protein [Dokdonella sp.]HQY54800.1 CSLREA domain-containing protein [Dokdonella sp.]HQZ60808.1 CSLREA domain-containing protein [Dokdonella sp.]